MAQTNDEGLDGSSIKPVSSLLAKFENMGKINDAPAAVPSRSVSPAPKTERPRDAAPVARTSSFPTSKEPPAVPKLRPKEKLNVSAANSIVYPNRPFLPPPVGARTLHPPSVTIEPPLSPPKRSGTDVAVGERPSFLSSDTVASSPSPRQFKISSRPHTPVLEARRSPRLSPSQPPSPPPPRRSAELRREREGRDVKVAPPPVNRSDKPLIPARPLSIPDSHHAFDTKSQSAELVSPFNTPPLSALSSLDSPLTNHDLSEDDELPPMLPTRPRPLSEVAPRTQASSQLSFEPPPVHHSVASKRKGREEENGVAKGGIVPTIMDQRPALPARPPGTASPLPAMSNVGNMLPPPRPPRLGTVATINEHPNALHVQQKRVVSTPTQQPSPTPTRTHGRSMTVDRTSSRVPSEFRVPVHHVGAQGDGCTPEVAAGGLSRRASSRDGSTAAAASTGYADTSCTNRSTPIIGKGVHEIATKYDSRMFDVCGELVCTTGTYTRVWSLNDGELLMSLAMGEGVKGISVAFKPGANVDEEGASVWIGNNFGDLMEADIATQSIVASKPQAHARHEVTKIYRHLNELWTLDDQGTLHVWSPDESGVANLGGGPTQTFRLPRGHSFSMVVGDELWHATGKEIRVFLPTWDGRAQFQVLLRPLYQDGVGEVTSGTLLSSEPDKVFFGHNDGKVTIYARSDYSCLGVANVSAYKINSLAGACSYLWAGYNNGKLSVFDMSQTPWLVKKEWQAHENPVVKLIADASSFYQMDRYQVVSLGADNVLRSWDGLLQDDWLEEEMKARDGEYCEFETIKGLVMTWNAGASTPHSLRYSEPDATFIRDLLQSSDSPDLLVFGFQELVDLEDKTATAKRILKPKKKEGSDQERMSHQYRDWRDFLVRSLDDHMSGDLYHLLHTAPLVGLFTCIFVKADLRHRISNLSSAEVKRGMGGVYGNKGAIAVRFMVDDTSFCFINCHLAAGQGNANSRHNDIGAILETSVFSPERDPSVRIDSFVGGGDGCLVLDHELCVLNGDLNYRIDTMSRDTVVAAVKTGNLAKLLERDQLLVARRRRPAFHLRMFDELPINFAPTYKYDVGTDNYDSSDKKRSPAWCDRLLFRGARGRVEQLDYRRHEVRVSDHRPVSGRFRFTVKRIVPKQRAVAWLECQLRWEDVKTREAERAKMYYLTDIIGYDEATAQQIIQQRSSRKDHRSTSRHPD